MILWPEPRVTARVCIKMSAGSIIRFNSSPLFFSPFSEVVVGFFFLDHFRRFGSVCVLFSLIVLFCSFYVVVFLILFFLMFCFVFLDSFFPFFMYLFLIVFFFLLFMLFFS